MPTTVTAIRYDNIGLFERRIFNFPNIPAGVLTTTTEYEFPIPKQSGVLQGIHVVNASTTFTVSIRDVAGGGNYSIEEIYRSELNNKSLIAQPSVPFCNSTEAKLYGVFLNPSVVATGVNTISLILG